MFHRLGDFISRWWLIVLGIWFGAFFLLRIAAPPFSEIAKGGQFVFLPETMPSRQGELLLQRAFPGRQTTSNMVIVVHREDRSGLTDDDRTFIDDTLKPVLEGIRDRVNTKAGLSAHKAVGEDSRIITNIHTFSEPRTGDLLVSEDQRASLVTVDLAIDFQDNRNWELVQHIVDALNDFEHGGNLPKGLQLALAGSATLGRDLSQAEADSAQHTGTLTITMVVILLVVIYRAPLMALVPLLTLFVAVDVSLHLLTLLAQAGYVPLFKGLQVYTTVTTYGPGIDYCLFLIARYRENLAECATPQAALTRGIGQVGSAIAASAATVICGIGMLTFAQFGKFHEAGIGISFSLAITLVATLTLTPALLFLTGHWAFWPQPRIGLGAKADQRPVIDELPAQQNLFDPLWTYLGGVLEHRPLTLLLGTLGALLPFAVFACFIYRNVNYGLLEGLPKSATSAVGARVLEKHFPAGITGPVRLLLQDSGVDFHEAAGISMVQDLVERLMKRREELKIADIRSVSDPLGAASRAGKALSEGSLMTNLLSRGAARHRSVEHYVSNAPELDGHLTELEIILTTNPFSMESVRILDRLKLALHDELPDEEASQTTIAFVGPTASVRDVNTVSQSDQQRIYVLVVSCVLGILVVLLRSICVSVYLIITVLLSYLTTFGITWLVFYGLDPGGFIGLD
ncbi:MAG: hypothetical protein JWN70_3097 [Planctomycetaceae bacterium]|nr:hypothetical protein [Planctomycetaceae bacterium]